ncbi:ecdysone receptor-like, partial [Ceratina calcarata]
MDTSDSSMDTTNGVPGAGVGAIVSGAASLTLVKAETPELLAGTSATPGSVTGPIAGATAGLFAGITGSKTGRPDDWLSTNSPGSPSATLQAQHVVFANAQQLTDSQQQQPPLAHSSPLAHQQQPGSNNGYASPMSTSSYDPYSPNSKI